MTRFAKIMAVLSLLAVIVFFLFLGSLANLFGKLADTSTGVTKEKRAHITVLKVEGAIMSSDLYMECIHRISEDKDCKGILLRIDSPGGAVGASQEIYSAVKALKSKGLPIVVSQGNLAASGGYYVSLAGDKIFANSGTLTASIGVIMQFPEASKLMDKLGIGLNTVKSGALKDVGNFSRKPTPEEMRYLQAVIDNTYGQFVDDVLANRKIARADLLKIADGRVMTGLQAKANGLVDTIGGYEEAKNYLVKVAKLEGDPVIVREPPAKSWMENLMETNSSSSLGSLSSVGALTQVAKDLLPWTQQGTFFLWK